MKISTLLLPTGEFAMILSGHDAGRLPDEALETFKDFREKCGAVAGLLVPFDIEVENAVIDENAVRADDEGDGEWQDIGYTNDDEAADYQPPTLGSLQINLQDTINEMVRKVRGGSLFMAPKEPFDPEHDQGDRLIEEQAEAGADFSPAGLVIGGSRTTAELEPEVAEAIAVPSPTAAPTNSGAIEHRPYVGPVDLDAEPEFRVGQRVRIDFNVVESYFDTPLHERSGRIGQVGGEGPFFVEDGEVVYWVALDSGQTVAIPAADLTPIDEEE